MGSLWRWADDGVATEYDEPLSMILEDEPLHKQQRQTPDRVPIQDQSDVVGPTAVAENVYAAPPPPHSIADDIPTTILPEDIDEEFDLELVAALTDVESSRQEGSAQSSEGIVESSSE